MAACERPCRVRLTSTQIAEALFISRRTVDNHIGAILRQLNVSSRSAAVVQAREKGWLDG